MNGQYTPGEIVFGNWTLTRLIGEGSFGRVFEAEREDFGRVYKAAIKIITIPQSQSEIKSVMADGMDIDSVTAYYRGFVEELVDEFSIMSRLKGNSNVVSYEDHTVVQHKVGIGWDILIRMELLTPLIDYAQSTTLTRKDVTQLGIDMCKALEVCQKFNIVHRDIKPENIFVSEIGDFKLGDFGIARTVEKTTGGLSKKGTYTYMAPEIYRGDAYGSSVDVYSLGIVLYRLLNDNRTPFLPEYPAPISHSDREKALAKRISGAQLPRPKNADGRLAEIVMKACAYDPKERHSSPMQMRDELEAILYNRVEAQIIYPQGDQTPVKPVEYVSKSIPRAQLRVSEATESLFGGTSGKTERIFSADADEKTESAFKKTPVDNSQSSHPVVKKNKAAIIVYSILAVALLVIFIAIITPRNNNNAPTDKYITIKGVRYSASLTQFSLKNKDLQNEDIVPLKNMTYLTNLDLTGNQISDISPLSSLTNLTELILYDNRVGDISPLSSLTNLTDLDLTGNNLNDISPLSSLTNLSRLTLSGNQVSDISSLSNLTDLTGLFLGYNYIIDISPLSSLSNLTQLFLDNNEISGITPLSSLSDLTWLDLDNNEISDISPLSSLKNLLSLDLSENQVSDISPLSSLTNLGWLHLDNNEISDISPLSNLANLSQLMLSGNQISDIPPLSGLANLRILDLSGNKLSDISNLSGITKLTDLYLSGNQISDAAPLSALTNLSWLYLENNKISDWSTVAHVAHVIN